MTKAKFTNPFRPGAGHMPPYLAGRHSETNEFKKLIKQDVILENLILTGLRGVGKTVLLDTFKPIAMEAGWFWVGTDLSESTSISEERMAIRLITDLAVATSGIILKETEVPNIGFGDTDNREEVYLTYDTMLDIFNHTAGLTSDKLKAVLEVVWACLHRESLRGVIFAYDEAQNLTDHAQKDQYPLSLLLDTFQSLQKKNICFMLALAGLPTLMPKLVEARTFAERMFHVLFLDRLGETDSKQAITRPISQANCPVHLDDVSIDRIYEVSGGYPYFIQFICREVYDTFLQRITDGMRPTVPVREITRKLDNDFFAGRWARATDRQRELLTLIAHLENCDREFTVQEVVEKSKLISEKPFSSSSSCLPA